MLELIQENLFAYILFAATLISGVAYFYDFKRKRPERIAKYEAESKLKQLSRKEKKAILEPQGLIGQTGSLFFVLLFVFLFRSFVYEPFRIPSGSMLPTLQSGDFIAVNKWSYGIRNPLTNRVIIDTSLPQRGDVVVFKYPQDKSVDFIKRIVGLPGDTVIYKNKQLFILKAGMTDVNQAELVSSRKVDSVEEDIMGFVETFDVYEESFDNGQSHNIRISTSSPSMTNFFYVQNGMPRGAWKIPDNCYFAMGDNRDNSKDSRFWGFVPFENIVGKTTAIWLSFDFQRSSDSIIPSWIPSSLRFDRIGGIR
ncbi:MAG: signal peptidase I [Succinivibrio sp.]